MPDEKRQTGGQQRHLQRVQHGGLIPVLSLKDSEMTTSSRECDCSDEKIALIRPSEAAGYDIGASERVTMVGTGFKDHVHSGVPFEKHEGVRDVTDERIHLQRLDSTVTKRPPWWLRQWTDLLLFLDSTHRRVDVGCTPAEAAVEQLAADVAAADALEQAVARGVDGGFFHAPARVYERIGEVDGEVDAVREQGGIMAHTEPPWLRVGTAERMTKELSQQLLTRLQDLMSKLDMDPEEGARPLLHITKGDDGDFDGTQRPRMCPALKRVHASIIKKALLTDVFASPLNLYQERAQRIRGGFRAQTPLIHAEYVTEEDARSLYDPAGLETPQISELPIQGTECVSPGYRSFVIHIDYIRFRPSVNAKQQNPDSIAERGLAPWSGITINDMPELTLNSNSGHRATPLVSFTPEEGLISRILDNYEPYRMMQLNLLPNVKGRPFYQDQLVNLRSQPHRTAEQNQLRDTLSELHQMSCKLERMYLREMVLVWRQIKQLRGENIDEDLFQSGATSFQPTGGDNPRRSLLWRVSGGNTGDEVFPQHDSSVAPDTSSSLLIDTMEEKGLSVATRFNMHFLRSRGDERRGEKQRSKREEKGVGVEEEEYDLLDYVPVISGVSAVTPQAVPANSVVRRGQLEDGVGAASPTLPVVEAPIFQVLVFARTNAMLPPQFVGCTAPRALSSAKVLFFNESFEMRTIKEVREILLHIVSVGGASDDQVVATVRVPPSLTYVHLLLPLQVPISFTHSGRTHSRYKGFFLPGVISLSTTWTTTLGMTAEEIEDMFLRGDADPMDPQYEHLLGVLRSYYTECKRHMLRGMTVTRKGQWSPVALEELQAAPTGRSSESLKNNQPHGSVESERLQLLRRRWLIRTGHARLQDDAESRLMSLPIPLDDMDGRMLQRHVKRTVTRERYEKVDCDFLFDGITHASADVCFPLVLSLSSLTGKEKLRVWQKRLRYIKNYCFSSRTLEDHELLERYVVLPRIRAAKTICLKPESYLNPRREERPKTGDIDREALLSSQDSRIVVHIMKASELPQRTDGTPLEPFVEVNFVYETVHTRTEVGTSPSWFETLNIPFCPPAFDDETLSLIEDDIVFSLYDKLEIQMPPTTVTTGAVSHETHYRTERRLLGTLRVPFFSLYEAEKALMEGQYPLSTPRWIFGYHPGGIEVDGELNLLHLRQNASLHPRACIQLYVALWPPLCYTKRKELDQSTISRFLMQLNVSAQLQHLHGVAMKWSRDALNKIKGLSSVNPVAHKREIEPFVVCATGDLTLVCRYLLPGGGSPPPTVTSVEEAIRFISLLLLCTKSIKRGNSDVWGTHVEFLHTREGGYEELSLLLAHFLRHLAPDEVTFVVTGRGTLRHKVVMVLHSFHGELRLIDPRTGLVHPVHDPHLTVFRDVHMVVSHNQLWANIQLSGTPHRMNWSLHDRRFWLECFDHNDDNVRSCLQFIAGMQREMLCFSRPDPLKVQEIEQQLQKAVREALITWRNNRLPAFHHGVTAVLRTLLEEAEDELCKYGNVRRDATTLRATELLNEYFGDDVILKPRRHCSQSSEGQPNKTTGESLHFSLNAPNLRLTGSPVNATYNPSDTNYRYVLQQVFETAVHEVSTNAVSFSIAVYVKGYTDEVYSMWVFLVAIYETAV